MKNKATPMSQVQMFWDSHRHMANTNEAFLFLVKDGMTSNELAICIKRRPELWGRFSNWLDKLPTKS